MTDQRARNQAKRLIATANELLALARDLERGDQPSGDAPTLGTREVPNDDPVWGELARQAYRDRRRRNEIFGNDTLFGEPAWDILLDLFIASKERKRVPVTSACIGAAVPPTTALRWLQVLEKEGLVIRESDPNDARRMFVGLTAHAYAKMVFYFSEASRPVRSDEAHDILHADQDDDRRRSLAKATD